MRHISTRGFSCVLLTALMLLSVNSQRVCAEIRLPHVLSDHAVLQRRKPVRIWGWAAPTESVTVRFHLQTVAGRADRYGLWEIWLKPEEAGGPYTLSVTGDQTASRVSREDVLVGDVWIASGQSNMEFPLKGFPKLPLKNGDQELAKARNPKLRLLRQTQRSSAVALVDSEDVWTECTPSTAKDFSAVAYFFGREIASREDVPVGLIDITWGGTPVHAWMSADGIASAHVDYVAEDAARIAQHEKLANELHEVYARDDSAAAALGQPLRQHEPIPNDHRGSWTPSQLYNGMISPYINYAVEGVIWYQGETDAVAGRASKYAQLFPALIKDWRQQWAEGIFPFLFVQLSSFGEDNANWGMVRDAQRRTLELESTGMAVTLDVGEPDNIHPPDKQTVGSRLASAAGEVAYGETVELASPRFVETTLEGSSIRVYFSHADSLKSGNEDVGDFELAGADHKFVPATGRVEGSTVVVTSPNVREPKYVRYGWKGSVHSWFYNAAGLPSGTFTSER